MVFITNDSTTAITLKVLKLKTNYRNLGEALYFLTEDGNTILTEARSYKFSKAFI